MKARHSAGLSHFETDHKKGRPPKEPSLRVDEAKVHRIQRMRRSGYTLPEISRAEKVSTSTVRRYTDPGYRIRAAEHSYVHRERKAGRLSFIERSERYHDNRRPLYDPKLAGFR